MLGPILRYSRVDRSCRAQVKARRLPKPTCSAELNLNVGVGTGDLALGLVIIKLVEGVGGAAIGVTARCADRVAMAIVEGERGWVLWRRKGV